MPRFTNSKTLTRLEQKKLKNTKNYTLTNTEQLALQSANKTKDQEYAKERLSALLLNSGKSQVQLAIELGVSQSILNAWLTGAAKIGLPTILLMAIENLEEKLGLKNNSEN